MTSETRRAGLRSVTAAIGMFAIGFLIVAGGIRAATEVEELDAMGVDAVAGMAVYSGAMDA